MASTYLTRTPGSAGDRKTWTLSGWYKRSANAADYLLSSGQYSSTQLSQILFEGDDYFNVAFYSSGAALEGHLETNRKFRDPSAWYHIVVAMDTAQAGSSDRVKIYVNGVQQTSFKTETYPAQDYETSINNNVAQNIGRREGSGFYNGQMAHVHFCDGQAYAASDFGETDATSGMWIAKTSPSVTYGTNGYFLKFSSGASGADSSGNGNTMSVSGTLTNLKDGPDNNFPTWSPLYMPHTGVDPTFSNCNGTVVSQNGSGDYWGSASTLGMRSGKWYAEFKAVTASNKPSFGITQSPTDHGYNEDYLGKDIYDYAYISDGGIYNNDSETAAWGNTFTAGDIVMVAVDLDNNKIYFGKNGTWQNSGDPTSGATGTGAAYTITSTTDSTAGMTAQGFYHFACSDQSTGSDTMDCNFGSGYFGTTAVSTSESDDAGIGSFEYDVPAGYYALCTTNLGDQS